MLPDGSHVQRGEQYCIGGVVEMLAGRMYRCIAELGVDVLS